MIWGWSRDNAATLSALDIFGVSVDDCDVKIKHCGQTGKLETIIRFDEPHQAHAARDDIVKKMKLVRGNSDVWGKVGRGCGWGPGAPGYAPPTIDKI